MDTEAFKRELQVFREKVLKLQERSTPIGSGVTESLVDLLRARDATGKAKYGTSLDRTDLTVFEWAEHMLQELLDGAGYLKALVRTIQDLPLSAQPPSSELSELNPDYEEGFVFGWERYHNILCAKLGLDPTTLEASNIHPGDDQEGRAGGNAT